MGVQARLAARACRSIDPDTVYAGVEDAALFRTNDGGKTLARTAGAARN
ncbi:MAG: hypothetical protein V9G24_16145 [Rhodoblastus sp.]